MRFGVGALRFNVFGFRADEVGVFLLPESSLSILAASS